MVNDGEWFWLGQIVQGRWAMALIGTLVLWSITSFILYTRNSFLFKLLLPLFLQQLVLSSYAYSSLKIAFKYHLSTILNQINYIICVWYPQRTRY